MGDLITKNANAGMIPTVTAGGGNFQSILDALKSSDRMPKTIGPLAASLKAAQNQQQDASFLPVMPGGSNYKSLVMALLGGRGLPQSNFGANAMRNIGPDMDDTGMGW